MILISGFKFYSAEEMLVQARFKAWSLLILVFWCSLTTVVIVVRVVRLIGGAFTRFRSAFGSSICGLAPCGRGRRRSQ